MPEITMKGEYLVEEEGKQCPARVLATDLEDAGDTPVLVRWKHPDVGWTGWHFRGDGTHPDGFRLIPKPKPVEVWLNDYPRGGKYLRPVMVRHSSRKDADRDAAPDRIRLVGLRLTPGQPAEIIGDVQFPEVKS